MSNLVFQKFFDILRNRPQRLLKKDFYLRINRILHSAFIFSHQKAGALPRLYFDLSVYSIYDNKTGVQRVIRSIYKEIFPILSGKYEIVPVSCTAFTKGFQVLKENDNGKFLLSGFSISPKEGDVFLSLEQAFVEHISQRKVFKSMKNKGCRIILTVYDLLPLQLPQCFPKEIGGIFQKWLVYSSDYAEYICDSQTVESDLVNYLSKNGLKEARTYWFYPGSEFAKTISTKKITEEETNYLKILKNFKFNFLMVGTIEPRKGHKVIFELFTKLWSAGEKVSLTFIGKEGWMVEDFATFLKNAKEKNVNFFWFNKASDEFLDLCYKETDAVIIASLNEGYGLPILEAAEHNCRIIANDIPVFREVGPEGCYFIDFAETEVAHMQLRNWINKPSKKCKRPSSHTWRNSTLQILKRTKIM